LPSFSALNSPQSTPTARRHRPEVLRFEPRFAQNVAVESRLACRMRRRCSTGRTAGVLQDVLQVFYRVYCRCSTGRTACVLKGVLQVFYMVYCRCSTRCTEVFYRVYCRCSTECTAGVLQGIVHYLILMCYFGYRWSNGTGSDAHGERIWGTDSRTSPGFPPTASSNQRATNFAEVKPGVHRITG
jgi:hypothetical protein